jgi:hypothetical protein
MLGYSRMNEQGIREGIRLLGESFWTFSLEPSQRFIRRKRRIKSGPCLCRGRNGAAAVANAAWIEVKPLRNQADLLAAQERYPLGLGEISSILLGKEIQADEILFDDYKAQKLARVEGFHIRLSVGLVETFYIRGELTDLRSVFRRLLEQ